MYRYFSEKRKEKYCDLRLILNNARERHAQNLPCPTNVHSPFDPATAGRGTSDITQKLIGPKSKSDPWHTVEANFVRSAFAQLEKIIIVALCKSLKREP